MNVASTLLDGVRAPLGGIASSLPAVDGIMASFPGDRLLSSVYSNIVPATLGDMSLINSTNVGRYGGVHGNAPLRSRLEDLQGSLPILNQMNIPHFEGGALRRGGLVKLPVDFVEVRDTFIDAFVAATELPVDAIRQFLEITQAIVDPSADMLREDIATSMTERKIVELYSNPSLDIDTFRNTLTTLRSLLPGSDESSFMGRPNLGLLEDVREQLFNGVFADGPLSELRDSASAYVGDVFPMIGKITDIDFLLDNASLEIGTALGLDRYPIESLSRLINHKFHELGRTLDMKEGVIDSVADVTKGIVSAALNIVPTVADMLVLLPKLSVDVLLEMVSVIVDVGEGLIDMKLAVIDFLARLPVEMIDVIVSAPAEVFADLEFAKLDLLNRFWTETQDMLNFYSDYSVLLDLTPELFPLEQFTSMSRRLVGGVPMRPPFRA